MAAKTDMIPAWSGGVLMPVEKLEVHLKGLRHKAVSVFVMTGENLLIQRRALGKYHTPGLWANTCCTHPSWGESAIDCAVRRLEQELGITGLFPAHIDRIEYRADVGGGMTENEVVDLFLAEAEPGLDVNPNPAEVMAIEWVNIYDLAARIERHPEQFTPWLKIYMKSHLDSIFGVLAND